MKGNVAPCEVCGKPSELVIVWLRSGDSETVCVTCHTTNILTALADAAPGEQAGEPVGIAP